MFKAVLMGLVLALSIVNVPAKAETIEEQLCPTIEEFARSAMIGRQAGLSLSYMIELVSNNPTPGLKATKEAMVEIVKLAFEFDRVDDEAAKQRAIDDYAELWARACWKETKKV